MDMNFEEDDEFAEKDGSSLPNEPSGESSNEPSDEQNLLTEGSDEDFTESVLRLKGINPDAIKFQDESGAIIERNWDSLSRSEQINILVDQGDGSENLDEDEINLLNAIRSSGASVNEYLQALMPEPETPSYKIDELTDEDVYILNLLDTVGNENISDEELQEQLEIAKLNEGLFKKLVEGLRQRYILLLQEEEAREASEQQEASRQLYAQFANSIQNEIVNLNQFAGSPLELSQDDMNELAEFTLRLDDSGMSAFGKAMQDPSIFTKAAFWILNENTIIDELKRLISDSYTRGYNHGKADKGGSKLVFLPKTQSKSLPQSNTINDLDFDEFD